MNLHRDVIDLTESRDFLRLVVIKLDLKAFYCEKDWFPRKADLIISLTFQRLNKDLHVTVLFCYVQIFIKVSFFKQAQILDLNKLV